MEHATTEKRPKAEHPMSELVTQGGLKFRIQLYYTALMFPALPFEALWPFLGIAPATLVPIRKCVLSQQDLSL